MINDLGTWSDAEQAELKKVFYSGAYEIVEDLQDALLKLETDPGDSDTLRAVKRQVHTLKGDSGSVGLAAVGSLCHRMEDVLSSLTDGNERGRHEATDLLLSCIDALRALLAKSESGDEGDDRRGMISKIDLFLNRFDSSNRLNSSNGSNGLTLSEYEELQTQDAVKSGLRVYEVEALFHPQCGEKSIAARMALQRLGGMGRVVHSVPGFENDTIDTADRITAVLATDRGEDAIVRDTLIAGIVSDVRVRGRSNAEFGMHPALALCTRERGCKRNAELSARTKANPLRAPKTELRTEMLRIEASRVDRLMNLVGELIIGRSMVDQAAKELGTAGANDAAARLRAVNTYLERTVSDLRKGVMKMRMVPVNQVFRKLPRMVRDLSVDKGKPVRLELAGKDTELDKGIVDNLGEPLAHIIRNMIDHGIEKPEQRRSAGKPEEGLITVRAYHEAAQIVIESSDDGKGIDAEKLKKKAVEKEFVRAEEAAKMPDAEAVNLIFLSGLSTAESVTETSGRGVGMDAVKSAVEGMRGSVELASTPGKGTVIRLRLPLTLAVIRALLFQVGEKLYAVPLSAVAEITKVMTSELSTVEGRDTLVLRDRSVSLVRMERLFKVPGGGEEKRFALILNFGSGRVGLLVDRIIAQQDLVIKPLEGEVSRSEMIAGASILGDGKVVIILDAPAMVRKAISEEKKGMYAA